MGLLHAMGSMLPQTYYQKRQPHMTGILRGSAPLTNHWKALYPYTHLYPSCQCVLISESSSYPSLTLFPAVHIEGSVMKRYSMMARTIYLSLRPQVESHSPQLKLKRKKIYPNSHRLIVGSTSRILSITQVNLAPTNIQPHPLPNQPPRHLLQLKMSPKKFRIQYMR